MRSLLPPGEGLGMRVKSGGLRNGPGVRVKRESGRGSKSRDLRTINQFSKYIILQKIPYFFIRNSPPFSPKTIS
jgi:hypothetical protein